MPDLLKKRFDLIFLSNHLYFDAAVRKISRIAGEVERLGMVFGKCSKADPLHLPADEDMSGDPTHHKKTR